MDSRNIQEQLLRRTTETLARLGEARRRETERRVEPPHPGDLFVFAATADFEVQWAVLEPPPVAGGFFLVVPADVNPQVGSADVAVPAAASSGALTLRCGFGTHLPEDAFDVDMRTGSLPAEVLKCARCKRADIDRGVVMGSALEREIDTEPEYRDWAQGVLAEARAVLSELGGGAEAAQG